MKIPIFGEIECYPDMPEFFNQRLFSGKGQHSEKMLK